MSCVTCTVLKPLKSTTDNNCKKTKQKIEEVRLFCPEDIVETVAESAPDSDGTGCECGFVSNIIIADPAQPEPFVCVEVLNPDDLDETNDFTYDRTEDEGDDQYNLTPLKIKVTDPDQQCMIDSLKGQDVGVAYKIENKSGEFVWRRMVGKLTTLTGGLLAGYELTFNADNPDCDEKPLFMNFGGAAATTTAMDAMTQF